jgi:Domain of unknown function (DUF5666)
MHHRFIFRAAGAAAAIVIACTGCASQNRPQDGGRVSRRSAVKSSSLRVEGMLTRIQGSTLIIAGIAGKTNVEITEDTRIVKSEVATLADVSAGEWLEARGERGEESSSFKAASVRISSGPSSATESGEPKAPKPEGEGGSNPSGGPMGGSEGQKPHKSGSNSGARALMTGIAGKVESVDGKTVILSVQRFNGESTVTLNIDDDTTFAKLTKAATGDLASRAHVIAVGERNADGGLDARRIELVIE